MLCISMLLRPALEPLLHLPDHLGVGLLHVRDPLDDLELLGERQPDQDLRRLVVREVAQDQRDRLRVLVLDERQQVLALRPLQER
jgi:hypothetical protein